MSNIQVTSITETTEQVQAALGGATPKSEIEEKQSAPQESLESETTGESETSETEELEAKESEDAESDESEESTEEKGEKPKRGFKKRIEKLSKQKAQLAQQLESLRSELEKYKSTKATEETSQTQEPQKDAKAEGKPSPDKFETYEEYLEALADFKLEQKEKAKLEAQKQEAQKTQEQQAIETHQKRVDAFKEKQADYTEVVTEFIEDLQAENKNFSIGLQELIVTSDLGPQIVYEFAKNPEVFEKLNGLGVIALAKEFGKLEDRLSKTSETPNEKKLSQAPKPLTPVNTKGSSVVRKSIYDPDISQAEYERLRKQMSKKA